MRSKEKDGYIVCEGVWCIVSIALKIDALMLTLGGEPKIFHSLRMTLHKREVHEPRVKKNSLLSWNEILFIKLAFIK